LCQKDNISGNRAAGQTLRDVIGMIINILDRIISKPDDVNARRLRLTHPVIEVRALVKKRLSNFVDHEMTGKVNNSSFFTATLGRHWF
jgi:hypothetical protein